VYTNFSCPIKNKQFCQHSRYIDVFYKNIYWHTTPEMYKLVMYILLSAKCYAYCMCWPDITLQWSIAHNCAHYWNGLVIRWARHGPTRPGLSLSLSWSLSIQLVTLQCKTLSLQFSRETLSRCSSDVLTLGTHTSSFASLLGVFSAAGHSITVLLRLG
jgi:hypothetical protein